MAPTLPDGSLALTRRLGRTTPLRRGDMVIVRLGEQGHAMVKRIIGLPGEKVALKAGAVHIDGRVLPEPYASPSVFTDSYRVLPDHYFLLGDNRDASSDSRTWRDPYVPRKAILGRIVAWPCARHLQGLQRGITHPWQP